MENRKKLIELLSKGNEKKVIKCLNETPSLSSDFKKSISMISNRYENIVKREILGLETEDSEKNKIVASLFDLVDSLNESDLISIDLRSDFEKKLSNNKKRIIYISVVVGASSIVLHLTGFMSLFIVFLGVFLLMIMSLIVYAIIED